MHDKQAINITSKLMVPTPSPTSPHLPCYHAGEVKILCIPKYDQAYHHKVLLDGI
jgi:hypothetical protein